jgi:hypothetical protein
LSSDRYGPSHTTDPSSVGRAAFLRRLPLKIRLLRSRKRILRLERRHRSSGSRLRSAVHLCCLFTKRLQLRGLPAQPADLDRACFRNKFTHTEILSRPAHRSHRGPLVCHPQRFCRKRRFCRRRVPLPLGGSVGLQPRVVVLAPEIGPGFSPRNMGFLSRATKRNPSARQPKAK